MRLTENFSLPCPDDTDSAALALYMQRLAEAYEAKILAMRALVTDFNTQPAGIWSNSSTLTTGANSPITGISLDHVIYTNQPALTFVGFEPFGAIFPESGVYHVGWSCLLALETGALTGDTYRSFTFQIVEQTGSGTQNVLLDCSRYLFSSTGLGATRVSSDGLAVVTASARPQVNANIQFVHGNTGSSMQILAGNWIGYWHRIGSTEQIEVV